MEFYQTPSPISNWTPKNPTQVSVKRVINKNNYKTNDVNRYVHITTFNIQHYYNILHYRSTKFSLIGVCLMKRCHYFCLKGLWFCMSFLVEFSISSSFTLNEVIFNYLNHAVKYYLLRVNKFCYSMEFHAISGYLYKYRLTNS